jgi:hypothetical protein
VFSCILPPTPVRVRPRAETVSLRFGTRHGLSAQ